MKILFAYKAFGAPDIEKLKKSLDVQQRYKETSSYDKLLATDSVTPDFPGMPAVRDKIAYTLRTCNFSKLRNMSIDYARDNGYSHVLLLDSDSVVISMQDVRDGKHFTKVIPDRSLSRSTRIYAYYWFLIHSDLYYLRWDEKFIGWGWEDVDYQDNVLRANGARY